jgi:L-asparaginase II
MDDLIQPRHPEQPAAGESANPVLVEVVRGDFVESRHRGAIAVVAPDGTVVHAIGDVTREMFPRSAIKPVQALHNNCSGKHAGMIATALHKGEAVDGYTNVTHPVQQRVLGVFESMTGYDLGRAARGIDGCTVPVWAMPLGNLALAMARMADPADQPEVRQAAVTRIRDAMAAQTLLHPWQQCLRHQCDRRRRARGSGQGRGGRSLHGDPARPRVWGRPEDR